MNSLKRQISAEFQKNLSSKSEFGGNKELAASALNELLGIISEIEKSMNFFHCIQLFSKLLHLFQ